MGLLDDAIREHLDLKRRRGADPAEVERAEREALGPVRRNPIPGEAPGEEDLAAVEGGLAYDHADDESWSHDSLQEPASDADLEPFYDEPAQPPPRSPRSADAPEAPGLEDVHDPFADEDVEPHGHEPARAPFSADPGSEPLGSVGPETAEYNVEDELAAEERAGDGEDVLEETPEFLQDTPDHDRLWFEQRPPRDFDFDE
jgi:hypothetical protein